MFVLERLVKGRKGNISDIQRDTGNGKMFLGWIKQAPGSLINAVLIEKLVKIAVVQCLVDQSA